MSWVDRNIHQYKNPAPLTLVELYNQFEKNVQTLRKEYGDDDLWDRVGPRGNVYRLNALEKECLKHQDDLQDQLGKLAEEFGPVLDAEADQDRPSARTESFESLGAAPLMYDEEDNATRRKKMLIRYLLSTTGSSDPEAPVKGFQPLVEFLCPAPPTRWCGFLLLPGDASAQSRYIKNACVALLVMMVKVFGPLFIILDDWELRANPIRSFFKHLAWRELICFHSAHDLLVTLIGIVMLLIIFEIVRASTRVEISNFEKFRYLPADEFWLRLGQATNILCIIAVVIAMPLVFWSEMNSKDIVFDSLSLLFILYLDDITHDVLSYLEMEDKDFQRVCTWTIALLGQCPIRLEDVVDHDAKAPQNIWSIRVGANGLVCAKTGKVVETRLMESKAEESEPLLTTTFQSQRFTYTCKEGQSKQLPFTALNKVVRGLWISLYYVLLICEVIFPIAFLLINKPCYA